MSSKLVTWTLGLTLVLMAGVYWQMADLRASMRGLAELVLTDRPIKEGEVTATITWTSGGAPQTHTATRKPGETTAEFRARFAEEVDAQFEQFPPD